MSNKVSITAGLLFGALLVPTSTIAQIETVAQIEEVIVTAQKRAEVLQEVPIAISALSNEALTRANVSTIDDLSNAISGINVQNIGGYVTPVVRGVGTVAPGSGFYQSVATYVDDVYVARSYGTNFSVESAESVQLLKGPQGALYGRNATAGAIIINTKNPEPGSEVEGNLNLRIGEYDAKSIGARIAGGLSDTVGASIEGFWSERDGYWDILPASQNPNGDDFGGVDEWSVKAKLVFEPSDNVNIRLQASHIEWEGHWNVWDNVADQEFPSAAQIIQINPTLAPGFLENLVGNPGLNANAFADAGLNSGQVLLATLMGGQLGFPAANAIGLASLFSFSPEFGTAHENGINSCELGRFNPSGAPCAPGGFHNREDSTVSLHMTFGLDRFDLLSISSFRDGSQTSATDVADIDPSSPGAQALLGILGAVGINNLGLGFAGELTSEDIQHEFRLVSNDTWNWQWIVGAQYFEESSDTHKIDANSFGGLARNADVNWENRSVSIYGQATFPLTDSWSATLGTRYISDDYEMVDVLDFSDPTPIVPVVAAIGPLGTLKGDDTFTTFLARLEYQADNWLGYASASSGYKSGSLNADGPAFGRADPEDLTSYELGFKSQWANDTFRLNGAVFYYDYNDPHVTFVDNATGGQVLLNIPKAEVTGAELDLNGVAGPNLNWYFNVTALDTEYKEDTQFNNVAVGLTSTLATGGKDMGAAPPLQAVAGLDYRIPIRGGELAIAPSVSYNSGVWYDPENRIGSGGAGSDDAYSIVNLNVRYAPMDANWSATLWAKNLLDEEYYSSGITANGFFLITRFGDPRQVGVTFNYDF